MTAKIVVIEDDNTLLEGLRDLIVSNGYEFQGFKSAEDFKWAANIETTNLLIVDRNLPGEDGLSLVKGLRKQHDFLPIMFLTTALSDEDIVEGLEAGANDYVTKPFTQSVLLARIKACLRLNDLNNHDAKPDTVNWDLDERTREVVVGSERYALSTREFQIFHSLSQKRGEVVTRDDLLSMNENISGRNVDVHIVSLRKKLDPSGILIQTIRGVGYRVQ